MARVQHSVRVDDETMKIMKDYKEATGISMAFLIKIAVKKYIAMNPPE